MPEFQVNSLEDAEKFIERFIRTFVKEYAYSIKDEAQINIRITGISDMGGLERGIIVRKTADGFEVISTAPYSAPVEYGSFPHWVPIEPLKGWSRRKLGDEKAAYAVQQKIAKEGTPAQPFMDPAIEGAFDEAWTRTIGRMHA